MSNQGLRALARRGARALGFGGATAALLGAYEIHRRALPQSAHEALLARYRVAWLDLTLRLFGVDLGVSPAPPPAARRARLAVSNHRSALDIAIMLRLFGGNIVSRADLARWPLLGAVARVGGTIFVEREAGMSRVAAARAVRRRLSEGGTVVVFPEGTTYEGDEVRPFHAGLFAALKGLDAEVVPVGLAYEPGAEFGDESFLEHLASTASRPRTRVVARIGTPRVLVGEPRAQAEDLRAEVQRLVREARGIFETRSE